MQGVVVTREDYSRSRLIACGVVVSFNAAQLTARHKGSHNIAEPNLTQGSGRRESVLTDEPVGPKVMNCGLNELLIHICSVTEDNSMVNKTPTFRTLRCPFVLILRGMEMALRSSVNSRQLK